MACALHTVALGPNNYLFAGPDAGGERPAAMHSLIDTAKLNGLVPEANLRTLLEQIADHLINKVYSLLSWNLLPKLLIETRFAT